MSASEGSVPVDLRPKRQRGVDRGRTLRNRQLKSGKAESGVVGRSSEAPVAPVEGDLADDATSSAEARACAVGSPEPHSCASTKGQAHLSQASCASLGLVPAEPSAHQPPPCQSSPPSGGDAAPLRPSDGRFCNSRPARRSSAMPKAFRAFSASQFLYDKKRFASLEVALASGPGCIDLFSGSRNLPRSLVRAGFPWVLCFDVAHTPDDLLSRSVRGRVEGLIRHGCALVLTAGPVCASFSRAVTPPCRTAEFPLGVPWCIDLQRAKCLHGNSFAWWCARLARLCRKHSVLYAIENPATSWIWKQRCWFRRGEYWSDFVVDYCVFKTPWRRRTRFRTSCCLGGWQFNCSCGRPHLQLRGYNKAKRMSWTLYAQPYPRGLCNLLSAAFASDCGLHPERARLDVASCARCLGTRIGEAVRPGPRGARSRRHGRLGDVQLVTPATAALQQRFWLAFCTWLLSAIGIGDVAELLVCPPLFVEALRLYGQELFSSGTPLHYYRQLLAFVSKEFLSVKPFLGAAWNAVTRWEHLEPLTHQPPLPEPILLAMVSLPLPPKILCWAALTALCFYGIARIGEPLHATRADLLTPGDLLSERLCVYLVVRRPKTRGSGAKVQHISLHEPLVIELVSAVFEPLPKEALLYPGSPAAYRRRWDALLKDLGIDRALKLTPGPLRGGGAVTAHQKGLPIADLQWAMRLQHQTTLGYYLQEVAAASVLPSFSHEARENVQAAGKFFPFLVAALRPGAH